MQAETQRLRAPRIEAGAIPKDRYTSRAFAELEWERMWTKVWLLAGRASDIPEPGDYFTFEIGTESILVIRLAGRLGGRALQRVHAPRQPAARAGPWSRRALLLPVPRLAVRHRRHAAGGARPGVVSAGHATGALEPAPGALRDLGRLRLRQPEPGGRAAARVSRHHPRAARRATASSAGRSPSTARSRSTATGRRRSTRSTRPTTSRRPIRGRSPSATTRAPATTATTSTRG